MLKNYTRLGVWLLVGLFTIHCKSVVSGIPAIQGSGKLLTLEKNFTDFDRIEAGQTFNLEISQGDNYRVTLRIDDNLETYLRASQSGRTLTLTLDNKYRYKKVTLTAHITLPDLRELQLNGVSSARLNAFNLEHPLAVTCSGTGKVTGTVNPTALAIELSGASRLALSGEGGRLDLAVSGASTADLSRFSGTDARVEISGASTASIHLSGTVNGDVSGASALYYSGGATRGEISTSGASKIVKMTD
ncbi:MAG: DUF2807 domain-containing protein [FCB group bacterium]|nr:DUF2807 domain-containing protein [FCB group bacterium]